MDSKSLRTLKRTCRIVAHEMMMERYQLYDAIWTDRIRITPCLYEHGKDTIADINQLMPNLLVHNPHVETLDCVSEQYGFASTSDLIDYLLAYTPRGPVEELYYTQLLAEHLAQQANDVDEVPF